MTIRQGKDERSVIWNITDVIELKKALEAQCSITIHFHDGCGGQYFTLDDPTEASKNAIRAFFAAKKLAVIFSEDGTYFSVEENPSC